MRTILGPILFLGIIQIVKVESLTGQDATDASVTNTNASSRYKDPLLAKLWPNRTLTSNEERIRTLAIALQNADKVLNGKRSRKNEQSEKPRIFGSPIMAAELRPRSDDGPRNSPRRNVRLRSRPTGRYSTPASVLLPPYKSYTPDSDFNGEKSAQPPTSTVKNNVVSTEPPTSRTASSSEIYEPPPTQPSRDETNNPIQQRGPSENNLRRYFPQNGKNAFENRQEFPSTPTQQAKTTFSPYWGTTTSEPLRIKLNTNATFAESARERGPAKYNQNTNDNEISKKTDVFSPEESGYHWGRRPVQTVNHYKFVDTAWKVGAIPGVPGQDYPVHQKNLQNNFRNPSSRFVCPVGPGTHVYLADRVSRCQIFYVCYGEKIGVPMMCPNGTLFSEHLQVCDWWFNVTC